jgi:N,N'-diacetyllegionaminate synthase
MNTGTTLVIAEIGSNHDNDLSKAIALVDAASDAGANVVKIQYWSNPTLLADRRKVPVHYREIYQHYAMPAHWLAKLREACTLKRIKFGITTYLPVDVPRTAAIADVLKIASFEAEARDLLDAHVQPVVNHYRPLIISLGMGAHRQPYCQFNGKERYLHCVSAYPAPLEALNLAALWERPRHLKTYEQEPDGFSDHSDPAHTWTGALAVAAGATIIEAHLRLEDTDARNPDAPHAMNPQAFREYVRHIRFTERCVGTVPDGHDVLPCEEPMAAYRVRNP